MGVKKSLKILDEKRNAKGKDVLREGGKPIKISK